VSNFCIEDLEHFATASHRYTGDIHNSSVVGLFMTPIGQWIWKRLDRVMFECTFITHFPTVTLQLHNFDLFRTCRTSSFYTVAWQLPRFQLTRRIARSLGDSWACENRMALLLYELGASRNPEILLRAFKVSVRPLAYLNMPHAFCHHTIIML